MKPRTELFETFAIQGITLRDYFAAQIISKLIDCYEDEDLGGMISNPSFVAEQAYSYADAMIEARKND